MIERNTPTNWSTLKYMDQSPKHYRYHLDHPRADTDALLRGRALHCAVYENHDFAKRYVVMPNFHGGMKDDTAKAKGYDGGKEAKAAWMASHSGEVLTSEMYESVLGMNEALKADSQAAGLIVGGEAEVPMTWTDIDTGIECRGRIDHVNGCLSDLKSTAFLSRFGHQIAKYQYHGQMAFYADGLEANGIMLLEPPCIIAVESSAPHDVIVVEFSEEDLAAGRALYRSCLTRLAECRRDNYWPGVSGGKRVPVGLPAWAQPETGAVTVGGIAIT